MPSKHLIRQYDAPAFYHVYNRGAGKQKIFHDSHDKRTFMNIIERHLLPAAGDELYRKYDIKLVAYCLMGNHFHFLFYQESDPLALSGLMKSVGTAYTMYYNRRYKSSGHLFQGPFRASLIRDESYLAHISRYIHLNPRTYQTYYWSSLRYYMNEDKSPLVHPDYVLDQTPAAYLQSLKDYEPRRDELKQIKDSLGI